MNRWRYVAFWAIIGMFIPTFMMGCGAELAATTPSPENTTTITENSPTTAESESSASSTQPSQSISQQTSQQIGQESTSFSKQSSTTAATSKSTVSTNRKPTATSKPPAAVAPSKSLMVGYYTGWSAGTGYTPDKIPANKLTHIPYAFAKIDPKTLTITLADPVTDRRNFEKLRQLKTKHPHLKTLISVGGWDYSRYFSDAAATANSRKAFAQSCVAFIREHGFDGVDLDWEYPVSGGMAGNHNRPQDKQNFTLLLQTLREQLDAQGRKDGKSYLLTIAGAVSSSYLDRIELTRILPLVDYIFLMSYDMHGPWDTVADFNAPLYTPSGSTPHYQNSVNDAIHLYLRRGASASKLVLGMPFYGYKYQGVSKEGNGLYSRFSSASSLGYAQLVKGYIDKAGYSRFEHKETGVPYLYGNNTFISYDDPASIAAKVRLARQKGLAGVGAWSLPHDSGGDLLDSAYRALQN